MPLLGMRFRIALIFLIPILLTACFSQVGNINDACDLLVNKRSWYKGLNKANLKWQVPKSTMLAFIHQESKFIANAKPPRKRFLGIIPTFRPSSAYGFPQALDSTWKDYKKSTGSSFADRDDFADAADFIGWYIDGSRIKVHIPTNDVRSHYLAYHEGRGGFARGTYKKKKWLLSVADKVQARALRYDTQLVSCEAELSRRRLLIF